MHMPSGIGDIRKALLKNGFELESEQHLGSQDQEPRFIQRRLQPAFDIHCHLRLLNFAPIERFQIGSPPTLRVVEFGPRGERSLLMPIDRKCRAARKEAGATVELQT